MESNNREIFASVSRGVNALLFVVVLGLVIAVSGLGWTTYYLVTHKSRTISPPVISQAFSVSDKGVDESYLTQMAEYFVYLRFNVTPASVDRKFAELSEYANESNWTKFRPVLVKELEFIKDNNVSSQLDVTAIQANVESMLVKVKGTLQKNVGIRALEGEEQTYLVQMSYRYGFLQLDYIKREQ